MERIGADGWVERPPAHLLHSNRNAKRGHGCLQHGHLYTDVQGWEGKVGERSGGVRVGMRGEGRR